jgi:DNA-binding NarL/FixJ family response regulator
MRSKQQKISILLAFGRSVATELISRELNRQTGFHVVACASTMTEVLCAVKTHEVNVALIRTALKDGPLSGIQAIQQIREAYPTVKSVLLIEPPEAQFVATVFRAGAKGVFYISQDNFKSLCRCIKQVHAGQIWANSAQLHEVLEAFSRRTPIRVVSAGGAQLLTKREEEIVELVADGLTNRQIAKELQLSEHTVRNNLFRIFDKLGISTRVELALYAVNHAKYVSAEEPSLPLAERALAGD